jgi:hypothetical protein
VPQHENPPLTAEQMEENLMRAASAHGKGRKPFNEELDKIFREELSESDNTAALRLAAASRGRRKQSPRARRTLYLCGEAEWPSYSTALSVAWRASFSRRSSGPITGDYFLARFD